VLSYFSDCLLRIMVFFREKEQGESYSIKHELEDLPCSDFKDVSLW